MYISMFIFTFLTAIIYDRWNWIVIISNLFQVYWNWFYENCVLHLDSIFFSGCFKHFNRFILTKITWQFDFHWLQMHLLFDFYGFTHSAPSGVRKIHYIFADGFFSLKFLDLVIGLRIEGKNFPHQYSAISSNWMIIRTML